MAESLICTQFHRSPCCVQDLHYDEAAGPIHLEVVKAIELTAAQYQHFASHMLDTEIKFEKSGKYGRIKEWGRNIYGSILKRWR